MGITSTPATEAAHKLLFALRQERNLEAFGPMYEAMVEASLIEGPDTIDNLSAAFLQFHKGQDVCAKGWGPNVCREGDFEDCCILIDDRDRLTGDVAYIGDDNVDEVAMYTDADGDLYVTDFDEDGGHKPLTLGDLLIDDVSFGRRRAD